MTFTLIACSLSQLTAAWLITASAINVGFAIATCIEVQIFAIFVFTTCHITYLHAGRVGGVAGSSFQYTHISTRAARDALASTWAFSAVGFLRDWYVLSLALRTHKTRVLRHF
jgi:thiosulfate reductase cytochrome b subunit